VEAVIVSGTADTADLVLTTTRDEGQSPAPGGIVKRERVGCRSGDGRDDRASSLLVEGHFGEQV